MRHNEHEISGIQTWAGNLGVDRVLLKTAQFYDAESVRTEQSTLPQFQRYEAGTDTFQLRADLRNRCKKLWTSSVIAWDGQVVPCCFDKDAQHAFGVIDNGRSLRDILRADPSRAFRRRLLADRSKIDICRNCTEGVNIFN